MTQEMLESLAEIFFQPERIFARSISRARARPSTPAATCLCTRMISAMVHHMRFNRMAQQLAAMNRFRKPAVVGVTGYAVGGGMSEILRGAIAKGLERDSMRLSQSDRFISVRY